MAITHTFAGSKSDYGYGYYAYIEDGLLVIGEDWPHEGGEVYRGKYADAGKVLARLKQDNSAKTIFNSIEKYYSKHDPDVIEKVVDKDSTEPKDDTAAWESSRANPAYTCSNCRYVALHNARGRRVASKFCPHCGKYMINHQEED